MWNKIEKALSNVEGYLTGTLLIAATLLLFVNVFLRYIFHSSTTWAEEAIRYAIIWVTFIGSAICARKGSHVGIDLFAQALPPLGKKIIMATGQFISAIFMAFCVFYGWQMFMLMVQTGQKSPAMLLPMSIVYFSMPLGFALTTIQFFVSGVKCLTKKPEEEKDPLDKDSIDLSRLN